MRADDGGEFWHVVAGAAVGGLLSSIDEICSVVSAYQNGGDVKKAWLHLGVSFVSGAVSGGLSAAGVGGLLSESIGFSLNIAESVANQYIDTKSVDLKQTSKEMLQYTTSSIVNKGVSSKINASLKKHGERLIKSSKNTLSKNQTSKQKRTHAVAIKNANKKYSKGMKWMNAYDKIKPHTENLVGIMRTAISKGTSRLISWIRRR